MDDVTFGCNGPYGDCIVILSRSLMSVNALFMCVQRFQTDRRSLPVLWHQSLLTFAQRYKDSISTEQRDALMALLRVQRHVQITDEVRRELLSAKCRDKPTAMEQSEPAAAEQCTVDMK